MQTSLLIFSISLLLYSAHSYVQFQPVGVPLDPSSASVTTATKKATYGETQASTFNKIARTFEQHNCLRPGCTFMGTLMTITAQNTSVYDKETLKRVINPERTIKQNGKTITIPERKEVAFSHRLSGGILITEPQTENWYMMYQFETPNPGTIYRMLMRLENDTQLSTTLNIPVNFSPYGGLWKPAVSTLTPSGLLLGFEGTGPDARILESVECLFNPKAFDCLFDVDDTLFYDIMDFMRYFEREPEDLKDEGQLLKGLDGIPGFKPYRYGYPYQISLYFNDNDQIVDSVKKLMAMGRAGASGISVMQNGFTIYYSGSNGGLYKFEDDFGNFVSGQLSAAVIKIKNDGNTIDTIQKGSVLTIEWIPLGKMSEEIMTEYTLPEASLTFSDFMDYEKPKGDKCSSGFKYINFAGEGECLKVLDDQIAVGFETERYAALKGATMDVFKFTQIATRLDSDIFYIAATQITQGSLEVASKSKIGGGLQVIWQNDCGCVFEVKMKDYNAYEMTAIMCGVDTSETDQVNKCSTENIANPRSLTFANAFEQLLIGEDSENHLNNFIWAYDPLSGEATRIFHAPKEGGITSINWFQDVFGGNNYIGTTIADPFDMFAWMAYFGSFDLSIEGKLDFSGVQVPYDSGPQLLPIGFPYITIGESEIIPGFTQLVKTGTKISTSTGSSIILGQVTDSKNNPVDSYEDGPVQPSRIKRQEISHKFGFASLISTCGKIYSIMAIDSIPAVSYVMSLKNTDGELVPQKADIIDWSDWGGLWRSGSGIITPWNTHLAGEIDEPNGNHFLGYPCITGFSSCFKSQEEDSFDASINFVRYYGTYLQDLNNKFEGLAKIFNPYNYGFAYEVKVDELGCITPVKYMTLGRFSHGGFTVMPDGRTVYMTDYTSGRNGGGGLFMFVADKRGDLSKGTLYAAKFISDEEDFNTYSVEWKELGSADNDDLKKMAADVTFNDIFEFIPSTKSCRLDQVYVRGELMCVSVKEGMEIPAAFFETRMYAALMEGTVEFVNTKGIYYDDSSETVILTVDAISSLDEIITQTDIEGSTNDLKLTQEPCGCLFKMEIDSKYQITGMNKFYCGTNLHGNIQQNKCSVEFPASPAQLSTIPGHGQLLIAEDSCKAEFNNATCSHVNNAIWIMDTMNSQVFTRIMTAPAYTSISALQYNPDINGVAYISMVTNELYEGRNQEPLPREDLGAVFGYIGPMTSKVLDRRVDPADPTCYKDGSAEQCPATTKS